MDLVTELEKLREFLHGAHLATDNENAGSTLHQACHKVDHILKGVTENRQANLELMFAHSAPSVPKGSSSD